MAEELPKIEMAAEEPVKAEPSAKPELPAKPEPQAEAEVPARNLIQLGDLGCSC